MTSRQALSALTVGAIRVVFGDSMITPAISVLAAVEGLGIVTPAFDPYIIPITLLVLSGLFFIQRKGTGAVGLLFGPVMIGWFAILGVLGIVEIVRHPQVLAAISPLHATDFIRHDPTLAFLALGSVVLSVTGGEALYTDLGHFGRQPIRLAWFGFVLPAQVLNYFGQGALLLNEPASMESPFFHLGPKWALIPMVVFATVATVIASQAVISGAFSVVRQAVQMGLLPRMLIVHTSGKEQGQIYIPFTNLTPYLAVVALVVGFKNSSNLAAAYGIAVTGTMLIDSILIGFVMVLLWRWSWVRTGAIVGALLLVDIAFFAANAIKIPQGGWFPIAMALIAFTVLTTWKRGRRPVEDELVKQSIPVHAFLDMIGDVHRVNGTAVFMTSNKEGVPSALLHNLKHNEVLHERVMLVTVTTADTPYVNDMERLCLHRMKEGFMRIIIRYGFMEDPDIPGALEQCCRFGERFDPMDTTFYLSRETIIPTIRQRRMHWLRARLFVFMAKNATNATDFFKIPNNRVVELGTQLVI